MIDGRVEQVHAHRANETSALTSGNTTLVPINHREGKEIMNDIQKQVQHAIDQLVESGAERGLQAAVYRRGELIVDAVAGIADPATGRVVTADTLFYSASVAKGVAATDALKNSV